MNRRTIILMLAAAVAGALIAIAVLRGGKAEEGEGGPAAAPQRVSVVDGEPTVTLDAATQQKIGIATTSVAAATQSDSLQLLGAVVDVRELAALGNQYAAARAQGEQAAAKAAFDRASLERLRKLNADNRNVSDRAVQEAAATVAADAGAENAARVAMQGALAAAAQQFGAAVANALRDRGALFGDLAGMRSVLLQISVPPGGAPPEVTVGGVRARYLSPAPRVDPKLQTAGALYVAPAGSLAAGMSVTATAPGARAASGAVVPRDAVVSWEGKSWVYVRRSATEFSRREIGVDAPAEGGFFVTTIPPGTAIVTTGAQQLLSEEMRAQLHEE